MFDVMDVNNDHLITLPDYLNFMDKQLHGTEEEKYSLSFKIFDVNKSGTVNKDEFSQMIKNICAMYASLLNSPMTIDEWVIETTFKKLDPTERGLFDEREYQNN
jgi:Ca2+-binding EF-hand superfamily protein